MQNFVTDPVKNPLATPSGKIELYSAQIASAYGVPTPNAAGQWTGTVVNLTTGKPSTGFPVPTYVVHTEDRTGALAQTYPLLHVEGGTKLQRHSQNANTPWLRDEMQTFLNGYRCVWINASDAAARGLNYGDVVKVYNARATILCAAKPTQRIMPGVIWYSEGGHIKQVDPGTVGSELANQTTSPKTPPPPDMGGNGNYLCIPWQAETICGGMASHSGLVQVAK